MRLDWNDIRARAAKFADEWKDAHYERGETQTFYNEFFELFGVTRRRLASFEFGVKLPEQKRGFLDLFWKGKLLIEQKSKGRDLKPARQQALDYFPGLKDAELPRYILLSDFQTFELYDLDIDAEKPTRFTLSELPQHIHEFGFIVGQEKRIFRDQDPANIEASEIMGALHDALESSGYTGHALERFLVRLLFCLFADDTGIFQPLGIFEQLIANTREDGSDVGAMLSQLFQILNTLESKRHKTLSAELSDFPYVNGDLFTEVLPHPSFDRVMREKLLEACSFRWEAISPAIFGSLFQSVLNKEERRKKGAHYTSEKNILKVIEPLFMDELKAEFSRVKDTKRGREKALSDFHTKLSEQTFFDPACGCGNFLVIAYRELRELELHLLKEMYPGDQRVTDIGLYTKVNVDQFFGIEIEEFPARIAEVAMWMTDHMMNVRLSAAFGQSYLRIPLKASPNIRHADALDIKWEDVLAPTRCAYVFGNPPFIGQSYQSPTQRAQMATVVAGANGRPGSLDYVTAWFLKAGDYVKTGSAKIAFVATNSITQGEQVAQLWPLLFDRCGLEIAFAHRTFEWLSDARGRAHVHCVIIGLTKREDEPISKRLFSYTHIGGDPSESNHASLSPYLFDATMLADRHTVVRESRLPIFSAPPLRMGSKIVDGGHLIFDDDQKAAFVSAEPASLPFFCQLVGSADYINGGSRWILSLNSAEPSVIRKMPLVIERINRVKRFRADSKKAKTRELANSPTRFEVMTIPARQFLVVPEVSSERRDYVPIGWLHPPTIPTNLVHTLIDADLWDFGLITSKMHMAWLRQIGGRLKSDYRYSIGIVYNTFPWPRVVSEKNQDNVRKLAQSVLDARAHHSTSTLADLYDPNTMPGDLRKAHASLDRAVDQLYRKEAFTSERQRVEYLLSLYEAATAPMLHAALPSKRKRKSRSATTQH